MTDQIKIIVKEVTIPAVVLTAGTPATWQLPIGEIYPLETLRHIDPVIDAKLESTVSYDASAQEFTFTGDEQSISLANSFFTIRFDLENIQGESTTFSQVVNVAAPMID